MLNYICLLWVCSNFKHFKFGENIFWTCLHLNLHFRLIWRGPKYIFPFSEEDFFESVRQKKLDGIDWKLEGVEMEKQNIKWSEEK